MKENILKKVSQNEIEKYNKLLDIEAIMTRVQGSDYRVDIVGEDADLVVEMITRDMLDLVGVEENVDNINLYKSCVKRMFAMKENEYTVKSYISLINLYKNPKNRKVFGQFSPNIQHALRDIYYLIDGLEDGDMHLEELELKTGVINALKRFGIRTVNSLKEAIRKDELGGVPKLGSKGIENIFEALEKYKQQEIAKKNSKSIPCNNCGCNLLEEGFAMNYNADIAESYSYNRDAGKFELDIQEITNDRYSNIYCVKCRKTLSEEVLELLDF